MAVFDNPENCFKCSAKCCRYFMHQIDTPRSRGDFENIRWYLCHDKITIFVEKKIWYIHVDTPCRQLKEDGRCGIYDNRPMICREHDPYGCEYDSEYSADLKFTTIEELDRYIIKRFNRPGKAAVA